MWHVNSWIVQNTTTEPHYQVIFDKEDFAYVGVTVVAQVNYSGVIEQKQGTYRDYIQLKDPVDKITYHGDTSVHLGNEVNASIRCNGSAPFSFCITVYSESDLDSGGVPSLISSWEEQCQYTLYSDKCSLEFKPTITKAGVYTLHVTARNDVSMMTHQVKLQVIGPSPSPSNPALIVVACVFIGFVVVSAVVISYNKDRKKIHIETADFNFHDPPVLPSYNASDSVMERVRYLYRKWTRRKTPDHMFVQMQYTCSEDNVQFSRYGSINFM